LAIANRQVADIETIFIVTGEAYAFTSSSLIRQIAALGGDVRKLASVVPELVIEHLERIKEMPGNPLAKLANDAHDQ
jgi:pantetheine-phosphate adenylyltransferase